MLLTTIALFNPVFAQANQSSYTVNLTYSTIQVTYPSQVMPGDSITVNVQVNPKNYVYLQTLTATIYYIDEAGLHQLTSQTLAANSNSYGYSYPYTTSSFSKSFQVTVPQNASRTSLEAMFSETAQSSYYNSYFAYPYYYEYPYDNYSYNCHHWYCEFSNAYPFYVAYPSYSSTSTDNAIAPLSYIKASTPEYVALQSQYAGLQSQYQSLQQQLQQSQTQNQQLQSTVSQQSVSINQLNQQLAASKSSAQDYETLAVGLGILAVIFAALAIFAAFRGRSKPQAATSQSKEQEGNQ